MVLLGLKMSIDTMPKTAATSAEGAPEWDSRKRNVGHSIANQGQPRTAAPTLLQKVDKQNM